MELTRKKTALGEGMLSPKSKTLLAALVAALVAGLLLFAFLQRYRSTVDAEAVPAKALVADRLIEKGTSGDVLASQSLATTTEMRHDALRPEAITDPALIKDKVATRDIYPGQQLTAADFAAGTGLTPKLAPNERAISIPLDAAHGMIGNVRPGDRVDVLSGFLVESATGRPRPYLKVMVPNALVLEAPGEKAEAGGVAAGNNKTEQVVLRVQDGDAAKLAFAADNGKVWLVLRGAGATLPQKTLITLESALFGAKTVSPARNAGGRGRRTR